MVGTEGVPGTPFTNSISGQADVTPVAMHGPDGTDYANEYVFLAVTERERIAISHPDPEHTFQLTLDLAEAGAMTRLTWRMRFDTAEHCDQVKPFVVEANEQNFDRLEAELARMKEEKPNE